ncbi:hypothetical protein BH11MYX1_BH11MYX1_56270 [soil metagenome]
MTAIVRTEVASTAKPEVTGPDPKLAAPTTPGRATPTDFAKQLQKATKPVVKKPTVDLGNAATAQSLAQPTTDTSALAQIIAAFVNGATGLTEAVPQAGSTDPKAALTLAVEQATTTMTTTSTTTSTAASGATTAEATPNALLEQMVAVKSEVVPQLAPAEPPLTPLEQAVHDLLSEVAERKQAHVDPTTAMQSVSLVPQQPITSAETALEVQHAAPIARSQPQELVSQNHAHLVIDDPNGRVVMTVAIRGNDVNVTMRASDDATAAALARNAGTLEDAMRGRGLALAQFDSQRDLAREQNRDNPAYQQREKQPKTPTFTLEETP